MIEIMTRKLYNPFLKVKIEYKEGLESPKALRV